MELAAFGIDTIRFALNLETALPINDYGYMEVLTACGWRTSTRGHLLDTGLVVPSTTAMYQDLDRPTFRSGIQNAGLSVWVECSIPAWYNGGKLNTALAHPNSVMQFIQESSAHLLQVLPEYSGFDSVRIRRLDPAADVAAGDSRAGVIAAASRFAPPRARKIMRGVFPGESAFTNTLQLGFKCYDKFLEIEAKLPPTQRTVSENEKINEWAPKGLVRMELTRKPRTGINEMQLSATANDYVQTLREGLRTDHNLGVVYVGGLVSIHAEIMQLGCTRARKSALFAFAYELATLGEAHVKTFYSKPTFYRRRAELLETGIMLDQLFNYDGYVDFNPVLDQIGEQFGVAYEKYVPPPSTKSSESLETARILKSSLLEEIEFRRSDASLERESIRAKKFFDPVSVTGEAADGFGH